MLKKSFSPALIELSGKIPFEFFDSQVREGDILVKRDNVSGSLFLHTGKDVKFNNSSFYKTFLKQNQICTVLRQRRAVLTLYSAFTFLCHYCFQ